MNSAFIPAFITAAIFFCIGHLVGWASAHTEVATECQRLQGFYVGSKVYECKLKQEGK